MYKTQSPDTDRRIEEKLFEGYRKMSTDEKLAHMSALGQGVEDVALAELRRRYPEASERENRLRLLSRWLDAESMKRIYDWDPAERGM